MIINTSGVCKFMVRLYEVMGRYNNPMSTHIEKIFGYGSVS
jgi:hypothetical protein